jgi:hypothetical protein
VNVPKRIYSKPFIIVGKGKGKGKGKVKGSVTPKQAYVALRGPGG